MLYKIKKKTQTLILLSTKTLNEIKYKKTAWNGERLQLELEIANNRRAALINLPEIEEISNEFVENTPESHGNSHESKDNPAEIGGISIEAPGNTSDTISEGVLTSDDIPEGVLDDDSDNSTLTPSSDGQLVVLA